MNTTRTIAAIACFSSLCLCGIHLFAGVEDFPTLPALDAPAEHGAPVLTAAEGELALDHLGRAAHCPAPEQEQMGPTALPQEHAAPAEPLAPTNEREIMAWVPFQEFLRRHAVDASQLSCDALQDLLANFALLHEQKTAQFLELLPIPGPDGNPVLPVDEQAFEAVEERFAALEQGLLQHCSIAH